MEARRGGGKGVALEIRVQPRARRSDIVVDSAGRVRLYVTASPEGGRANAAALALLADRLGVPKSKITIVRGQRARDKVVRIDGADDHAVLARLRA